MAMIFFPLTKRIWKIETSPSEDVRFWLASTGEEENRQNHHLPRPSKFHPQHLESSQNHHLKQSIWIQLSKKFPTFREVTNFNSKITQKKKRIYIKEKNIYTQYLFSTQQNFRSILGGDNFSTYVFSDLSYPTNLFSKWRKVPSCGNKSVSSGERRISVAKELCFEMSWPPFRWRVGGWVVVGRPGFFVETRNHWYIYI